MRECWRDGDFPILWCRLGDPCQCLCAAVLYGETRDGGGVGVGREVKGVEVLYALPDELPAVLVVWRHEGRDFVAFYVFAERGEGFWV